jgi:hypothetical protein
MRLILTVLAIASVAAFFVAIANLLMWAVAGAETPFREESEGPFYMAMVGLSAVMGTLSFLGLRFIERSPRPR